MNTDNQAKTEFDEKKKAGLDLFLYGCFYHFLGDNTTAIKFLTNKGKKEKNYEHLNPILLKHINNVQLGTGSISSEEYAKLSDKFKDILSG